MSCAKQPAVPAKKIEAANTDLNENVFISYD
jgi:hypothetical protein